MSKRLAITVSAAVSLGSYEAGVVSEVIRAVGQRHQDPNMIEEENLVIDFLAGASMGGTAAAILDRSGDTFKEPGIEGITHGGALVRAAIKDFFIKPKLNTLLKL